MPQINYTQKAVKDLKKINSSDRNRILRAIEKLTKDDIEYYPLIGPLKGLYKLRVGSYRIIFNKPKPDNLLIRYIRHRKDVYNI